MLSEKFNTSNAVTVVFTFSLVVRVPKPGCIVITLTFASCEPACWCTDRLHVWRRLEEHSSVSLVLLFRLWRSLKGIALTWREFGFEEYVLTSILKSVVLVRSHGHPSPTPSVICVTRQSRSAVLYFSELKRRLRRLFCEGNESVKTEVYPAIHQTSSTWSLLLMGNLYITLPSTLTNHAEVAQSELNELTLRLCSHTHTHTNKRASHWKGHQTLRAFRDTHTQTQKKCWLVDVWIMSLKE